MFAYYGSDATGAASISPIDGQLEQLRRRSDALEDSLKKVARCDSDREFLGYLDGG